VHAQGEERISGYFRSEKGANYFCHIRGFIFTVKEQGKNVLSVQAKLFSHLKSDYFTNPKIGCVATSIIAKHRYI